MNVEQADIPMLSETELRKQHANLQRRALQVGVDGPSCIDRLNAAIQLPPSEHADEYVHVLQEASDEATLAVQRYHNALLFLETAGSLLEALARPPAFDDGMEWHDELLYRLAEVLETAAELVAEGEVHLERASRVNV